MNACRKRKSFLKGLKSIKRPQIEKKYIYLFLINILCDFYANETRETCCRHPCKG